LTLAFLFLSIFLVVPGCCISTGLTSGIVPCAYGVIGGGIDVR